DVTDSQLWERRMNMLFDLSDALLEAEDVKSYWQAILGGLEAHASPYDVPLAALYSVECRHPTISESSLLSSPPTLKTCRLEGSIEIPVGHPLIPETFNLRSLEIGLGQQSRAGFDTRNLVILRTADGTLPPEMMSGVALRGFGDECSTVVICPIQP